MTYRGKVRGGVVVFDAGALPPDGTDVRIEPIQLPSNQSAGHFRPVGSWVGPPGELEALLGEVQKLREEDTIGTDDAEISS